MLNTPDLVELVREELLPPFERESVALNTIDSWARWSHDQPHSPRQATREYRQLAERAHTPWLTIPVTAVSQQLMVDGYREAASPDNDESWAAWQANAMDSRQIAIHRAALTFGLAYATVLPGEGPDGPMPSIRGVSPRRMMAFYDDAAEDDWPVWALRVDSINNGARRRLRVYDAEAIYTLTSSQYAGEFVLEGTEEHHLGVVPVVRFANSLDLDGRSCGEIEPLIPLAGRIDQGVFDRLVVQRFSSWVVRTIAGMAKPEVADDAEAEKLRLKVEDILVAEDPDTKFGFLPATPLDGFIAGHESDLRDLAAISQVPAHHLLGSAMSNLSAEALAASEQSLSRKVSERRISFGESHEQVLRFAAELMGRKPDFSAQVLWRDTESKSLASTADALGKLATMLGVPVEFLWEKVPGWSEADVVRVKELRDSGAEMSPAIAAPAPDVAAPAQMPADMPPARGVN